MGSPEMVIFLRAFWVLRPIYKIYLGEVSIIARLIGILYGSDKGLYSQFFNLV